MAERADAEIWEPHSRDRVYLRVRGWVCAAMLVPALGCQGPRAAPPSGPNARPHDIARAERRSPPQPRRLAAPAVRAPTTTRAPLPLERPARIPSRDLSLEGALTLPPVPGPHPGIVLIHGSGPIDRDAIFPGQLGQEFGRDVSTFRDLASGLARAGYAVLRYDKRSCNRETGCENSYPIDHELSWGELVDDARAALDYMARQPDVDARRLILVGHSQGAALVPALMAEDPRIVAGVLLAGPHRPLEELWEYQADYLVALDLKRNTHPLVANAKVAWLRKTARSLRRLRAGRYYDTTLNERPIAFWRQWSRAVDHAPVLARRLRRPLLALSGSADTNVPPSETQHWAKTLEASPAGHRTMVIPCVTHALNCSVTTTTGTRTSAEVDPRVIAEIVAFLSTIEHPLTAATPATRATTRRSRPRSRH